MFYFDVLVSLSFGAVDSTKAMLGTFSPQAEPYQHVMPEEITPSGIFARGSYSARTKVYVSYTWTKNQENAS